MSAWNDRTRTHCSELRCYHNLISKWLVELAIPWRHVKLWPFAFNMWCLSYLDIVPGVLASIVEEKLTDILAQYFEGSGAGIVYFQVFLLDS